MKGPHCDIFCVTFFLFPGDITIVNLGMTEDDYAYLTYEIDTIIHAAATVNLIYPYRALHSSNVLGTRKYSKLCTSK